MTVRSTRRWMPLLAAGAALLLASAPAWAGRGRRGGPPDPDRQVTHLTRYLDLTEEQQEEVRSILEQAHERGEEIRDKEEGCRAEVREEMRSLREDTHEKIAEILTEEQRKAWQEFLEDFRPPEPPPRRGPRR